MEILTRCDILEEIENYFDTNLDIGWSPNTKENNFMNNKDFIHVSNVKNTIMSYRKYSPTIIDDLLEELGLDSEKVSTKKTEKARDKK